MKRRYRVRPNPIGSFFGGVVGLIFVGIGLFVVIPTFGPFGMLWTLVAGVITIVNFFNAFSDRGIANEIIEEDIPPAPAQPHFTTPNQTGVRSVESRLRELDDLRNKGLVTTEEHARLRAEILQGV